MAGGASELALAFDFVAQITPGTSFAAEQDERQRREQVAVSIA
jgi:hypothetical protein